MRSDLDSGALAILRDAGVKHPESGMRVRSVQNWPDPLRPEAYHGVAGDLVRAIEPHSEADPAAILLQTLVAVGSVIGRTAYFLAEADRHHTSLYAVIVGPTAKGRKGTSWGHVRQQLGTIDQNFADSCIVGGLASGEGLISALGDAPAEDKRLLVIEPEYARVLTVCEREGNTLSAIIRQGWDTGTLRVMTRHNKLSVSDAHISIIGHITRDELLRLLTGTAAANGWAKLLPDGGALDNADLVPITRRIQTAVEFARRAGELWRDDQARAIWHRVYPDLSEGRPGLLGAVTSRAEAQTMRLATIYAVLDCSPLIRAEHLTAALAVWTYCEASARWIFGGALGDATADEIMRALREMPNGMTRTEIREHFGRHKSSPEIARALSVLAEYGRASMVQEDTGGRPTERWRAL